MITRVLRSIKWVYKAQALHCKKHWTKQKLKPGTWKMFPLNQPWKSCIWAALRRRGKFVCPKRKHFVIDFFSFVLTTIGYFLKYTGLSWKLEKESHVRDVTAKSPSAWNCKLHDSTSFYLRLLKFFCVYECLDVDVQLLWMLCCWSLLHRAMLMYRLLQQAYSWRYRLGYSQTDWVSEPTCICS